MYRGIVQQFLISDATDWKIWENLLPYYLFPIRLHLLEKWTADVMCIKKIYVLFLLDFFILLLLLTCIKQVTKYIVANCVLSGRDKIIWERSEAATGALACNFIKIETLAQVFSGEFCEFSKNTFFTEHVWGTASRRCSTVDLMSMIALRKIFFFLSITTIYEPFLQCLVGEGKNR